MKRQCRHQLDTRKDRSKFRRTAAALFALLFMFQSLPIAALADETSQEISGVSDPISLSDIVTLGLAAGESGLIIRLQSNNEPLHAVSPSDIAVTLTEPGGESTSVSASWDTVDGAYTVSAPIGAAYSFNPPDIVISGGTNYLYVGSKQTVSGIIQTDSLSGEPDAQADPPVEAASYTAVETLEYEAARSVSLVVSLSGSSYIENYDGNLTLTLDGGATIDVAVSDGRFTIPDISSASFVFSLPQIADLDAGTIYKPAEASYTVAPGSDDIARGVYYLEAEYKTDSRSITISFARNGADGEPFTEPFDISVVLNDGVSERTYRITSGTFSIDVPVGTTYEITFPEEVSGVSDGLTYQASVQSLDGMFTQDDSDRSETIVYSSKARNLRINIKERTEDGLGFAGEVTAADTFDRFPSQTTGGSLFEYSVPIGAQYRFTFSNPVEFEGAVWSPIPSFVYGVMEDGDIDENLTIVYKPSHKLTVHLTDAQGDPLPFNPSVSDETKPGEAPQSTEASTFVVWIPEGESFQYIFEPYTVQSGESIIEYTAMPSIVSGTMEESDIESTVIYVTNDDVYDLVIRAAIDDDNRWFDTAGQFPGWEPTVDGDGNISAYSLVYRDLRVNDMHNITAPTYSETVGGVEMEYAATFGDGSDASVATIIIPAPDSEYPAILSFDQATRTFTVDIVYRSVKLNYNIIYMFQNTSGSTADADYLTGDPEDSDGFSIAGGDTISVAIYPSEAPLDASLYYSETFDGFTLRRVQSTDDPASRPYVKFVPGEGEDAGKTIVHIYYDRETSWLNFDSQGGTPVPPATGYYGQTISLIDESGEYLQRYIPQGTPAQTGQFIGWFTPEGDRVTAETLPLAKDARTLYAHWAPNPNIIYQIYYWLENVNPNFVANGIPDESGEAAFQANKDNYSFLGAADAVPESVTVLSGYGNDIQPYLTAMASAANLSAEAALEDELRTLFGSDLSQGFLKGAAWNYAADAEFDAANGVWILHVRYTRVRVTLNGWRHGGASGNNDRNITWNNIPGRWSSDGGATHTVSYALDSTANRAGESNWHGIGTTLNGRGGYSTVTMQYGASLLDVWSSSPFNRRTWSTQKITTFANNNQNAGNYQSAATNPGSAQDPESVKPLPQTMPLGSADSTDAWGGAARVVNYYEYRPSYFGKGDYDFNVVINTYLQDPNWDGVNLSNKYLPAVPNIFVLQAIMREIDGTTPLFSPYGNQTYEGYWKRTATSIVSDTQDSGHISDVAWRPINPSGNIPNTPLPWGGRDARQFMDEYEGGENGWRLTTFQGTDKLPVLTADLYFDCDKVEVRFFADSSSATPSFVKEGNAGAWLVDSSYNNNPYGGDPVLPGYVFKGWSYSPNDTADSGKEKYEKKTSGGVASYVFPLKDYINVYAIWEKIDPYTVTFDGNEPWATDDPFDLARGSGALTVHPIDKAANDDSDTDDDQTLRVEIDGDDGVTDSLLNNSRANLDEYDFVGWFYATGELEGQQFVTSTVIDRDIDLIAKWAYKSMATQEYIVHYYLEDPENPGNPLIGSGGNPEKYAQDKIGRAPVGDKVVEFPAGDTARIAGVDPKYRPTTMIATLPTIVEIANGNENTNVITFLYRLPERSGYIVHYYLLGTTTQVAADKTVDDIEPRWVYETALTGSALYAPYKNYIPTKASEWQYVEGYNVFTFYYVDDTLSVQALKSWTNSDGSPYTGNTPSLDGSFNLTRMSPDGTPEEMSSGEFEQSNGNGNLYVYTGNLEKYVSGAYPAQYQYYITEDPVPDGWFASGGTHIRAMPLSGSDNTLQAMFTNTLPLVDIKVIKEFVVPIPSEGSADPKSGLSAELTLTRLLGGDPPSVYTITISGGEITQITPSVGITGKYKGRTGSSMYTYTYEFTLEDQPLYTWDSDGVRHDYSYKWVESVGMAGYTQSGGGTLDITDGAPGGNASGTETITNTYVPQADDLVVAKKYVGEYPSDTTAADLPSVTLVVVKVNAKDKQPTTQAEALALPHFREITINPSVDYASATGDATIGFTFTATDVGALEWIDAGGYEYRYYLTESQTSIQGYTLVESDLVEITKDKLTDATIINKFTPDDGALLYGKTWVGVPSGMSLTGLPSVTLKIVQVKEGAGVTPPDSLEAVKALAGSNLYDTQELEWHDGDVSADGYPEYTKLAEPLSAPKYAPDGESYHYYVIEDPVPAGTTLQLPGFAKVTPGSDKAVTLTNKLITITFTFTKKWEDSDGNPIADPPALTAANVTFERSTDDTTWEKIPLGVDKDYDMQNNGGGTYSITPDLPSHSPSGMPYTYRLTESEVPEGYHVEPGNESVADGGTITNIYDGAPAELLIGKRYDVPAGTKTEELPPVVLQWIRVQSDEKPSAADVKDTPSVAGQSIKINPATDTPDAGSEYTYTETLLQMPMIAENGERFWYYAKEADIPNGYRMVSNEWTLINESGSKADWLLILDNKYDGGEQIVIKVTKYWKGAKVSALPNDLLITLQRMDSYGGTASIQPDAGSPTGKDTLSWVYTFTVPKYDTAGQPYTYVAQETPAPGFKPAKENETTGIVQYSTNDSGITIGDAYLSNELIAAPIVPPPPTTPSPNPPTFPVPPPPVFPIVIPSSTVPRVFNAPSATASPAPLMPPGDRIGPVGYCFE